MNGIASELGVSLLNYRVRTVEPRKLALVEDEMLWTIIPLTKLSMFFKFLDIVR